MDNVLDNDPAAPTIYQQVTQNQVFDTDYIPDAAAAKHGSLITV